ncbi:beta-1,6-N-acetylglucosaminyltransferase [Pseudanabaena sp. PCC 6802]|uniref:beta-1,6-N-acetylglucosaminyltransferase n=1 Tax=Pseudanabaena sp. PCC 6802 TaxID=118173 RepID=UPI000346833C|nr:beta-1,6-N-acetylglucosaminyltransferase [Pseudanabaena sp. PCC 6802]
MKVCYLIQTHANPQQILRLVSTIRQSSDRAFILIDHDPTNCQLPVEPFQKFKDVTIINANKCVRGDFTLVQNYLDAVEWLLDRNIQFDWLTNLSGQDYPTQPLERIEQFLATTEYDGFLEWFDVLSPLSHWTLAEGQERYFYQYWRWEHSPSKWQMCLLVPLKKIVNRLQPYARINLAYGFAIGRRAPIIPFSQNFICYGGSHFKTLSRQCVEYLYRYTKEHPDLVEYYAKTLNSDESYMQTVLVNSRQFNLCNANKMYVDFSQTRYGRPKVLTVADYASLTTPEYHFARKFDLATDSAILDRLDSLVLR